MERREFLKKLGAGAVALLPAQWLLVDGDTAAVAVTESVRCEGSAILRGVPIGASFWVGDSETKEAYALGIAKEDVVSCFAPQDRELIIRVRMSNEKFRMLPVQYEDLRPPVDVQVFVEEDLIAGNDPEKIQEWYRRLKERRDAET